tara:strand:+ start:257 stop:418 length:162 start_codon:yes stop_codon:yes gene_type:complete
MCLYIVLNLLGFIFKCVVVDFEKDKSIFLSNISEKESKELDIIGYNNWVKINI